MDTYYGVVADPEVPEVVRIKLAAYPEKLIPFRSPASELPHMVAPPQLGRAITPKTKAQFQSRTILPWFDWGRIEGGAWIVIFVFWPLLVLILLYSFLALWVNFVSEVVGFINWHYQLRRSKSAAEAAERLAISYHRSYVVPDLDFDREAQLVWRRVSSASETIRQSRVVRSQLIDSAQILSVMPYHLWDIAERSARLSELRQRLSLAMSELDPNSPGVQAVSQPLQRTSNMAVADIEQRVKRLEDFADLIRQADETRKQLLRQEKEARMRIATQEEQARKQEQAFLELGEINDLAYEILPLMGGAGNDHAATGQEADDVRAVIERTKTALRRATEEEALRHDVLRRANEETLCRVSEAVRSLIIPDVWPPQSRQSGATP